MQCAQCHQSVNVTYYAEDEYGNREQLCLACLRERDWVMCRECGREPVHHEGETCGECLSAMAEYYHPDEGGSQ